MNISTLNFGVTTTIPHEPSNQIQTRFVYLSFYIVLMIVDLWLIISLIHYGIKTKKWRRFQPGNPNSLSSGRIYLSVIICSVAAFFYHLFIAVYRNIGFHQNEAQLCKAMSDLIDIMYTSCLFSVIFFLWFRQRALYTAFLPMVRFTKLFNFFSFISIVISSVLGITSIILLILTNDIAASSIGCVIKNNRIFQLVTFMISGIAIIFGQVSLLVVFIHVLIVMQEHDVKERWKSLFCCKHQPSIEHTRGQPVDETKTIVDKIIKKATVFAALSLFSDLLVVSLSFLIPRRGNRHEIISALGSISVSMNLYFVILSFITWKDMITSPCKSLSYPGNHQNQKKTLF